MKPNKNISVDFTGSSFKQMKVIKGPQGYENTMVTKPSEPKEKGKNRYNNKTVISQESKNIVDADPRPMSTVINAKF